MIVLGGSVTARSDASTGPEWPTLVGDALGLKVTTRAVDGSGFVSPGQGRPFAARVDAVIRRSPDVIVVAGGLADLGAYPTSRIATSTCWRANQSRAKAVVNSK